MFNARNDTVQHNIRGADPKRFISGNLLKIFFHCHRFSARKFSHREDVENGKSTNVEHPALLRPLPPCFFFQIQISRQLPAGRGPRGSVVLGLVTLTMAVGYYKLGQANKGRRAEKHEKRMARIALMPMLQVGRVRDVNVWNHVQVPRTPWAAMPT